MENSKKYYFWILAKNMNTITVFAMLRTYQVLSNFLTKGYFLVNTYVLCYFSAVMREWDFTF